MIPILYSQEEKQFESNGLGRLIDAANCTVTEEENGAYTLSLEYPANGLLANEIQLERIVSAKPYDGATKRQAFRISNIRKQANGTYDVEARHVSYQRSYIPVSQFDAANLGEAIAKINTNANRYETCPFTLTTTIPTNDANYAKPFAITEPMSLGKVLMEAWQGNVVVDDEETGEQEDKGGLQKIYGGTYEWDNWDIKLLKSRGSDKGVTIRYGKNLIDLDQEEAIDNMITGVLPIYNDSEEGLIVCNSIVYTEGHNNYPYNKTVIVDISSSVEDEDRIQIMKDDSTNETNAILIKAAQKYIADNDLGKPDVVLTVNFQNLADTEEYKNIAPLENVQLGDTVTVIFEKLNISKKARVVEYTYDVLKEKYESITLGDYRDSWMDEVISDAKNTEIAIKNASSALASSYKHWYTTHAGWLTDAQGTVVPVQNDDGTWSELLFLNAPTTGAATQCMRVNRNGIGFGSGTAGTFGSWTYDQAWTIDGVLTLGGTKVWIQDGNTTTRTGHGRLEILDENGNMIGRWDQNGIMATKGTFSGDLSAAGGTFTGTLSAATGSFEGSITATSGTIGGITIGNSSLYAQGSEGRFSLNTDGSITHSSVGSDTTTNMHAGIIYVSNASSNSTLSPSGIVTPGGTFGKWNSSNGEEAGISITGDIWLNGTKLDLSNAGQVPHSRELRMDYGPEISDGYSDFGDYDVRATKYGDLVTIGRYHVIGYNWMQGWITEGSNSSFDSLRSRVTALENGGGGSSSTDISATMTPGGTWAIGSSHRYIYSTWDISASGSQITWERKQVDFAEIGATSDVRLKKDITDLKEIKNFYLSLSPKQFNYVDRLPESKSGIHYGLLAQDLVSSMEANGIDADHNSMLIHYDSGKNEDDQDYNFSDLVDGDDWYYGINYNNFHAMHIAMIQQQEHRIEELEKENADLKARLEKLESIIFTNA